MNGDSLNLVVLVIDEWQRFFNFEKVSENIFDTFFDFNY
jgi:hypothetical protein